ncbi:MAG TPA: hypothetical protein VFE25_11945 [Opitutaceae bacterium]|jgi:hypothetical protein|nr:hypothetical protein [Opitutaceae bacterium]
MPESSQGASPCSPHLGIISLLRAAKIDLSDEKRAQDDIADVLTQAGISFGREVRLSAADIVDFAAGGLVIEVKLHGARKKKVYRQLCRYARHPSVSALMLASSLSMGLPAVIEGKDVYFVKLGEGWL